MKRLPAANWLNWRARTGIGRRMQEDADFRVWALAAGSLAGNGLFALYHGALGIMERSSWMGGLCGYYLILCALRAAAVVSGRRREVREAVLLQLSGILLMLLSASLMGVLALSLRQGRAAARGEIVMITIALWTFVKIGLAVCQAARGQEKQAAALTMIRSIRYAEVGASILTMQQSMLVSFGDMPAGDALVLNALTGAGVGLLILLLGARLCSIEKSEELMQLATSKLVKVNRKIAKGVVSAYQVIEKGAVSGYNAVERFFVGAYLRVESAFIERYLTREGETVEEARKRLAGRG